MGMSKYGTPSCQPPHKIIALSDNVSIRGISPFFHLLFEHHHQLISDTNRVNVDAAQHRLSQLVDNDRKPHLRLKKDRGIDDIMHSRRFHDVMGDAP